jgi:DNA-binding GntR family transcriptional regulator
MNENVMLPTEREMMVEFNVTRGTVRRALTILERDGWITRHPKRGAVTRQR